MLAPHPVSPPLGVGATPRRRRRRRRVRGSCHRSAWRRALCSSPPRRAPRRPARYSTLPDASACFALPLAGWLTLPPSPPGCPLRRRRRAHQRQLGAWSRPFGLTYRPRRGSRSRRPPATPRALLPHPPSPPLPAPPVCRRPSFLCARLASSPLRPRPRCWSRLCRPAADLSGADPPPLPPLCPLGYPAPRLPFPPAPFPTAMVLCARRPGAGPPPSPPRGRLLAAVPVGRRRVVAAGGTARPSPPPTASAVPPLAAASTNGPQRRRRRRPPLLTPFFARPTVPLPRGWSGPAAAAGAAGAPAAAAIAAASAAVPLLPSSTVPVATGSSGGGGRPPRQQRSQHPPATAGQALAVHLLSGGLSAGLVRAALLPLDTAKTRLQAAARAGVASRGGAAAAAGLGGSAATASAAAATAAAGGGVLRGVAAGAGAAGGGAGGGAFLSSAASAAAGGRAPLLTRLGRSAAATRSTALAGAGGRGLYRGLAPALAGVVPAAALYMGVYQSTKAALLPRFGPAWAPAAVALAAAIGDTAASLVRAPCELVKQRLQVGVYGGIGGAVAALRGEGLAAVYVGLPAQLARDIPFAATEFLMYEALQSRERQRAAERGGAGGGERLRRGLGVGAVSGAVASLVSNPLGTLPVVTRREGGGVGRERHGAWVDEGSNGSVPYGCCCAGTAP